MAKPKLIEQAHGEAEYGYQTTQAIIDHPKHGRLLITDGFGGQDSIYGGMVRWRHGYAVKLQPEDTLESLTAGHWNEHVNHHYEAVMHGYDDSRPVMEWDSHVIESIAKSVGL